MMFEEGNPFLMADTHPAVEAFRTFWLRERPRYAAVRRADVFDKTVAHLLAALWGHWPLEAQHIRRYVLNRRAERTSRRRIEQELAILERILQDQSEVAA